MVSLTVVLVAVRIVAYFRDPLTLITSYYDDLDFRRFEEAYRRLNPATRPSFEPNRRPIFRYRGAWWPRIANWHSLHTTILKADAQQMQVQVETRYITAFSDHTDTQTLVLTNDPTAGWRIEPGAVDMRTPPDQFLHLSIEWLSVSRRPPANDIVDDKEPLERPALEILSAHLVKRVRGGYSVGGESIQHRCRSRRCHGDGLYL